MTWLTCTIRSPYTVLIAHGSRWVPIVHSRSVSTRHTRCAWLSVLIDLMGTPKLLRMEFLLLSVRDTVLFPSTYSDFSNSYGTPISSKMHALHSIALPEFNNTYQMCIICSDHYHHLLYIGVWRSSRGSHPAQGCYIVFALVLYADFSTEHSSHASSHYAM